MAIYHASLKTFSRAKGQSAVAAAAYRAGVCLWDERGTRPADYSRRTGVGACFITLPKNAPSWMADRAMLWNMAEWTEKRCNAVTAREWELALPAELPAALREQLVRSFCAYLVARYGVAVDAALHLPGRAGDERNYHAHVMFSTRAVTETGFGKKTRILDERKSGSLEVKAVRAYWANLVNETLAAARCASRVDHRSHADRGIDAPPQIHEGVTARNAVREGEGAKLISFAQFKQGRVIDWPAIDHGHTRAAHNADIIALQNYRKHESLAERLSRLTAQLADAGNSMAALEARLGAGEPLPDSVLVTVRLMIERLKCVLARKAYEQSDYVRKVEDSRRAQKELAQQQAFYQRLVLLQQEAQQDYQQERAAIARDRALVQAVLQMPLRLNGVPPYVIRLQVPPSAAFNAASLSATVKRQSTATLFKSVHAPPPQPRSPAQAPLVLHMEVLKIKELLDRVPATAKAQSAGSRSPVPVVRVALTSATPTSRFIPKGRG